MRTPAQFEGLPSPGAVVQSIPVDVAAGRHESGCEEVNEVDRFRCCCDRRLVFLPHLLGHRPTCLAPAAAAAALG